MKNHVIAILEAKILDPPTMIYTTKMIKYKFIYSETTDVKHQVLLLIILTILMVKKIKCMKKQIIMTELSNHLTP